MKKLLYILSFTASAAGYGQAVTTPAPSAAATQTVTSNAEISFAKTAHWFGQVKMGTPVTHKFPFRNTGQETLVIYECQSNCVCTSVKCEQKKVNPGETGFVEVSYDSVHVGTFAKDFFIISNAKNGKVNLVIRGIIETNTEATEQKK